MTVYRRGKGKAKSKIFTANFTAKGKRYSFSTGEQTKRRALAVEAAERQKILKQSKLSPEELNSKTPLLDAIDQVYEARWRHTKDSQRSYRRAINLAAITGNIPLLDITDTTILHLTKVLEAKGATNSTINRYLAALKTILKHHKQPVDCIKLRKEPRGRIRTLSKEEELKVVNLLRAERDERRYYFPEVADLVEVLADSGLRCGEALTLTYQDVDYGANLLTVWINKGNRPRSIPLTKRARSILLSRQASNPVKPFTVKSYQVSTAWNFARKAMGLELDDQFVPHALRHSFCSRLITKGVGLPEVQLLMGHASIATTISVYSHIDSSKLASAIKALED